MKQVEHRVGRRLEYSALDTVQPSRKFVVWLKDPSNQTEAEIGQQTVQVMAPVIPDVRMPDKRESVFPAADAAPITMLSDNC